jgi:hypothetical protein
VEQTGARDRGVRPVQGFADTRCVRRLVVLLASLVAFVPGTAAAAAEPVLEVDGPAEVRQGETFTVTVVLRNAGDSDGTISFMDVVTPVTGPDGREATPEDGIELQSAGFANTVSRGSGFTFDSLGRVLHPLLAVNGSPEVIEGKPGNELWVSYDQLNQIAFAGGASRFDAEFRMGKQAQPGQPLKLRFRGGYLRGSPTGGPVVSRELTLRVTPTAVTVEEIAAVLASDPVSIAPSAEASLSSADESILETAVRNARTPVFLAVLPSAAGAPQSVLEQVVSGSGRAGTFAVLVGNRYRATSDRFPQAALDAALQEAGADDPDARPLDVLTGFVRALDDLAKPAPQDQDASGEPEDEQAPIGDATVVAASASSPPWGWIVSGAIAGVILLLVGGRAARRSMLARKRRARLVAELRGRADDELTALGEDIAELDLDVEMPGADAEAKSAYAVAVDVYDKAGDRLPRAESPQELEQVIEAIAAGRAAMARAKQRLNA